jgi:hypothetical protein
MKQNVVKESGVAGCWSPVGQMNRYEQPLDFHYFHNGSECEMRGRSVETLHRLRNAHAAITRLVW